MTDTEIPDLVTQDLVDFLQLGTKLPVLVGIPGEKLPTRSDAFVVVTPFGGGGFQVEMLYEVRLWQIRTIGAQSRGAAGARDASTATEKAARAIDRYIHGADWPLDIAGVRVQYGLRSGGGPYPMATGDQAGRSHFVASYLFPVASGL